MNKDNLIKKGLIYEKTDSFCTDSQNRMVFRFKPKEFHELISELSQLKQGYPKEFVEWFHERCGKQEALKMKGEEPKYITLTGSIYKTLDELYQYWLTIKDK